MMVSYGYGNDAWHCRNSADWYDMWGTPTADLTVNVSALNNPANQTAAQGDDPNTQIDLNWTLDAQSHNVMIVRKIDTESWTEPTQGTSYSVDGTIGSGVVVYKGSAIQIESSGLTKNTTYDYKFYSENNSYYSPGVTAQATTTPEPGVLALAGLLLLALRKR